MEFKVTYRVDTEEYFCTDDYLIIAESLFEAARVAHEEIEQPLRGTIWSIERI